jgi:hypothetical protein
MDNNYSKKSNINIDHEVSKLFKKYDGKISSSDILRLRHKYDDDKLYEEIIKAYNKKYVTIHKRASKFAKLIMRKYSNQQYPYHILLEKAKIFKQKYSMSDEEFDLFEKIYEQSLTSDKSPDILPVTTNMMNVLGSINVDFQGFSHKLNDSDYKFLQEILKLNASSKPLHAQVLLQSLQYVDCDFEALTGQYKRELGNRPGDSIHPVIAAMFLPKIDVLDYHFLHSNISGIVKSRYNNEPLNVRSDYSLFYSLISDPNDIVCNNKSSILDLLNRSNIQTQLWNCVLNLRNGLYYNTIFREFITSIDMCKLNKQDNPDLIYGRYDGTILKRLLSAFSFRPTTVATMPVYNIITTNPYQQNIRPMVTRLSIINLRLPPTVNDSNPISLNDALEQHQFYWENGMMIPKQTSIIHSNGVLFFYVDRRANVINFTDMQPFNISRLPIAVAGFERLNDREVDFDMNIHIRGDNYRLRSVVLAEVNENINQHQNASKVVIGSSAAIVIPINLERGITEVEYLLYDAIGVIDTIINPAGQFTTRNPISQLHGTPGLGPPNTSFIEMARKRGIIFMYELIHDVSRGEIPY